MSDPIRYLCVDDQGDTIPQLLAVLEAGSNRLKLDPCVPEEFDTQTRAIIEGHLAGKLDGLLVDLRLDEPNPGIKPVHYSAQGLAQQLRALSVTNTTRGFPIALWSVSARLLQLNAGDSTSHDLFDLVLDKEKLVGREQEIAGQLVALSDGYREISKKLAELAPAGDLTWFPQLVAEPVSSPLDVRVADSLPRPPAGPIHEYALHILRFLIKRPGPLIDADELCARLGVATTSSHTAELMGRLPPESRYAGPFCTGWPRWWSGSIEKWWRQLAEGMETRPLASVPAERRVEVLGAKLGLTALEAAKPIIADYSTNFTTICHHLHRPLDPIDGFALAERSPRPWLDKRYVSKLVALSPAEYNFREPLDGLEKRRLERIVSASR